MDSAWSAASVFLSLSKTHKWNVLRFTHSAKHSISCECAMAGLPPHGKSAAWTVGTKERSSKKLPIDCDCHCLDGIEDSLSDSALLTFIRLKKANAARPRGKWSVCFALNTLLTDCRAGMVRWTQTVCQPGCSPPCPTLVPLCQCADEGSVTPCPRLKNIETRLENRDRLQAQSSSTDKWRGVGKKTERCE